MSSIPRIIAILGFGILISAQVASQDIQPRYVSVAIGHIAAFDQNLDDPGVIKVEYRFRPFSKWQLSPIVGGARSASDASFVFSALEKDFYFGRHWVLAPSFGIGLFDDGENIDLGSKAEFRSGIKAGFLFKSNWRFSLELFHLSNGGLSDRNPGTEPIFLSLAIPLD